MAEGTNLAALEVDVEDLRATRFLVRNALGWQVTDATSPDGVHAAFLTLGTSDTEAASTIATRTFSLYANPTMTHTAEIPVMTGSKPYVNYNVGDTVTLPDEWGTPTTVRFRALTVAQQGERVTCVPEFGEV